MIEASRQNLKIAGNRMDLIFEVNHIFDLLIHKQPELIIATMTAWSELLIEATDNLTEEQHFFLNILTEMSDDYIKLCKGQDIDDD